MRRILAALALIPALALAACDEPADTAADRPADAAPDLVALTLDGDAVDLAAHAGQVVVVNFWLAECGPCLAEMPDFDAYYRDNRDRGLAILAVNMGQEEDRVRAAARRLPVSFPLLVDPLSITTERYGVQAAPTTFIIGRDGRIHERVNGPLNAAALERKIGPLL